MPSSLKRPAADTTGKAAGKAAAEPADAADGKSKPRLKIQKKTYRQSRPWEGPTISEALTVGEALSTAYPGKDGLRAVTFATVSLSGFAPGPTLGKLLGTLAPTVTCTAEAARPASFNSAMLSMSGFTQHGAFRGLAKHAVKLEGGTFKCITCSQHRRCSLGNVDILLMDGMPAAGEEAAAVQSFVTAVNPSVQICCQPYSDRKALSIDPTWEATVAGGYGLPIATPIMVLFTGRDAVTAKRICQKFTEVECEQSVHPYTLLGNIPAGLIEGAAADLPKPRRAAGAAAVGGEDRVLADWKDRGWVKPCVSRDEFTAVLREPGKDLQAQGFAVYAGKLAEARMRAVMLRQMLPSPSSFAIASTGKNAVFHTDGSLPDFRDAKANPMVAVCNGVVRVLSFIEVMALCGYQPELHNLATEPYSTRSALAAAAIPAPLWVMALLAAVTELNAQ